MSNNDKKSSKFDGIDDLVLPLLAALSIILMIACLAMLQYSKQMRPNDNQRECPKALQVRDLCWTIPVLADKVRDQSDAGPE
jgi:hypothetical protein